MATSPVVQAQLARNLLSSVLALGFPETLATDNELQTHFLAHADQLQTILHTHNVFGYVTDGKAFDKFHTKVFQVIDQPQIDRNVQRAAFELLLVVVEQCPLEVLEKLTPRLMERILKIVKYHQAPNEQVTTAACNVARVVVRHVELFAPEVRRELFETFTKFLPSLLSLLNGLGGSNKSEFTNENDIQLWSSGISIFTELLEVSPNALRSYVTKIEAVCVMMFHSSAIAQAGDQVYGVATKCLGLLSNASDKSHQLWKQLVDKAIEMLHLQVDFLSGKRSTGSSGGVNMKGWMKDSITESLGSVYSRAHMTQLRLQLTTAVLTESMQNRGITEREVQLVLNEIIVVSRRALSVRAYEVGKQTAVSEDGFRLPTSVVYSILPHVHRFALEVLTATIDRAGLCALRHASKIGKVLLLASENVGEEAQDALYSTISACMKRLGASSVEKLGVPLLDVMVSRCKGDLDDKKAEGKDSSLSSSNSTSVVAVPDSKAKSNQSKGKKRKRQAGDISQLSVANGANLVPFMSIHNQQLLARNIDAALQSIAVAVGVYGCLLPLEARSAASELGRFVVQQQQTKKNVRSSFQSVALLLLSDCVSADASNAHARGLVTGMDYWRRSHPLSNNNNGNFAAIAQVLVLNVGEALLHPRAPPMTINFQDSIDGTTATEKQQQFSIGGKTRKSTLTNVLRGEMDWDTNVNGMKAEEEEEEGEDESVREDEERVAVVAQVETTVTKRQKVVEVKEIVMESIDASKQEEKEAERDDDGSEEEDYADERPVVPNKDKDNSSEEEDADEDQKDVVAQSTTPSSAVQPAADDDDDDEFPDIIDDDDE